MFNPSESQPHRIRQNAENAGIRHGDRVRVQVSGVEVRSSHQTGERTAYFCNSRMQVLEHLKRGDGGPLPEKVEVRNLGKLPDGESDIEAIIESNGHITLERVTPAPPERGTIWNRVRQYLPI